MGCRGLKWIGAARQSGFRPSGRKPKKAASSRSHRWRRNRSSGATHVCPLRHLFLFIGADPNAAWLENRAAVDDKGFVLTGLTCPDGASAGRRAARPLETSFPGVFAIGDVRAGSTKRVAAAVGEGAAVVAQIHTVLALQPEEV